MLYRFVYAITNTRTDDSANDRTARGGKYKHTKDDEMEKSSH